MKPDASCLDPRTRDLTATAAAALAPVIDVFARTIADAVARHVIEALREHLQGGRQDAEHLLDSDAAAARLGISKKTLYRRIKDGRITYVAEDGGGKRFRPGDLTAYVNERVQSPARAGALARSARR